MELIFFPLSFVFDAGRPRVNALAVTKTILELPHILGPIRPSIDPISVDLVVAPLTVVLLAIWPGIDTRPVLLIRLPVSRILSPIRPRLNALPILKGVLIDADVDATLESYFSGFSVLLPIFEVTLMDVPCRPVTLKDEFSASPLLLPALPLA